MAKSKFEADYSQLSVEQRARVRASINAVDGQRDLSAEIDNVSTMTDQQFAGLSSKLCRQGDKARLEKSAADNARLQGFKVEKPGKPVAATREELDAVIAESDDAA